MAMGLRMNARQSAAAAAQGRRGSPLIHAKASANRAARGRLICPLRSVPREMGRTRRVAMRKKPRVLGGEVKPAVIVVAGHRAGDDAGVDHVLATLQPRVVIVGQLAGQGVQVGQVVGRAAAGRRA